MQLSSWISSGDISKSMLPTREPVAQRQEVVSGTLALLKHFHDSAFKVSRAADSKGTKSCRTQGESVHPYQEPRSYCSELRPEPAP